MSEEIEDIDDDGGLLNRLGNILEKSVSTPAGVGLFAVLIGGLLKSTHGVTYDWIDVMGPYPSPLPRDVRRLPDGRYQRFISKPSSGLDVKLDIVPFEGTISTEQLAPILATSPLASLFYLLFAKKGEIIINKEFGEVWLSDLLITAGLAAIAGSAIAVASK